MTREAELVALLERARDELYTAKVVVRQTRNHTKVTAASLQDRETAIDELIAEIEELRNPTPEEAQDHGSDRKQVEAVGR